MSRVAYFVRETAISLRRNLLMTLAGILTVAVSLFLFGGILLVSYMVDNGTARWREGVELEIFMNVEATEPQIDEIEQALLDSPDVEDFTFLTKQDAFEYFEELFQDDPELVENVDAEALPPSFRVVPTEPERTAAIITRLENRTGVDDIISADEAVDNMLTAIRWIRYAFFAMAGVLLASSLFLIVNTIRLATYARRREIEVMKLVGASNWFVRIPFMAEGLVQGAIGAGISFGMIYLLRAVLTDLVRGTDNLFKGFFVSTGDAVSIGIFVLFIGAAIGIVGSLIGLRRFLEA